ncbi:NAD(P)/FAD-dependent oxidoreductase [Acetobacter sp. AN02]|uniref:NAD(P)/FAD-dependent oxidoreductase n=1 Tax=Acetobacter sp. AN02 TaxID=2894186 RepID=UPI002434515D|nr:NAD(P)/FAD-dependent oxidoreductase [Acetobacter sp. AN02]MDG6095631.1 NAD(P)/FAD-dependent oxidoreductase [Acetobacter sp. AN02]
MAEKAEILIVGGGVAGLALATRLGDHLGKSGKARITLIDKSFSHVWKPMLHCFAAGTASSSGDCVSFMAQASNHHFEFWPGEITALDRKNHEALLGPVRSADNEIVLGERKVSYDALILAIGSCANDFGTPGVEEHCLFIDSLPDATGFNDRFRMELVRAFATEDELDIAIVGGGATGTQLAAELHKALDLVTLHSFGDRRPVQKITLLEAGPRILPGFPEEVSAAATKELESLGIRVMTSAMVAGAQENGLSLKDGTFVQARLRVWAAGVKAPDATRDFDGLSLSKAGQILIKPNLQSIDDDRIFALGDCSYIQGEPLPPTAQVARQQAHHLARTLPDWLLRKKPIPPCVFRNKGAIVALGDYNGWAALPGGTVFGGGFLRGLSARLGHIMLYRQHQAEIYGLSGSILSCVADWIDKRVRPSGRLR